MKKSVKPALLAAGLIVLTAIGAAAVPPDPERPLSEQTCVEASVRLYEAMQGSPLLSAERQALALATARADALRLCGMIPENLSDDAMEAPRRSPLAAPPPPDQTGQ